jgi:sulfite reductase beta subunit-like hemoprotein
MNFNVHKWNKQRYLAEAGIYETATLDLAKEINKILPESLGYKEFAKAVAKVLKDEYGSQNFKSFMNVLHDELGMEPLKEEAEESTLEKIASELKPKYPELRFDPTSDRIDVFGDENDKVTFANAERKTKFEDGYRMFDVEDDDRGYMVRIVKNK